MLILFKDVPLNELFCDGNRHYQKIEPLTVGKAPAQKKYNCVKYWNNELDTFFHDSKVALVGNGHVCAETLYELYRNTD
jgi:hypothetical protein